MEELCRELEAELGAERQDAQRYRWIAANPRDNGFLEWLEPDQIDEYIDAALAAEGKL